ncbi:MAG: sel1 repeat family protein, partial [Hyphomicrobiales bacterium]|nr:sel1 repeat family protein [Hyphomicrobiales bacterium]
MPSPIPEEVLKVFATPTFSALVKAASRPVRNAVIALLAVLLLALAPAARAQEVEEGAGFFSYRPAAPKLNLPNLDLPFWTDDLKKAKKAYNNGNYDRAIKFFRRASEDGNIVADWYLGHIYRNGRGVPRDDAMAFSYYARVAEAYDPDERDQNRLRIMVDAQLRVADYYRVGIADAGIKANHKVAARSYLKIASTYGHPGAQYSLGLMNIKGQGVKKNPQQGLKWLIAAARKRHALSEAYLGDLYWDGKLVQRDRTRALMWYILAQQST